MSGIIKRNIGASNPTSATSNLNLVKSVDQLSSEYKSGFQVIADSKKKSSESDISTIQEGIVYYLINNANPIQYFILSHESTKPLEGICIKAFCDALDNSSKLNPRDIYAKEIENKKINITEQDKERVRNSCLAACSALDTFVPKDPNGPHPSWGDKVILHYNNDALASTGEPIAGTYEVIKAELSFFNRKNEFFEFLKPSSTTGILNVVKETASNLATVFTFGDSQQIQEQIQTEQLTNINPIKQSDNQWGNIEIVAGKKISAIGCLLTCYTMANNGLNNQNLNPADVLNKIKPLGAFSPAGLLDNDIITRNLSLKYETGPTGNTKSIKNFIDSSILEGNLAILHVDYTTGTGTNRMVGLDNSGDHFILCIKKDENGNYICNDPATGSSITLNKDNLTCPSRFKGQSATYKVVGARKVSRG